jgi:hypothetical protein
MVQKSLLTCVGRALGYRRSGSDRGNRVGRTGPTIERARAWSTGRPGALANGRIEECW